MDGPISIHEEDLMKGSNDIPDRRNDTRVYMDLPLEYQVSDAPHRHGALVVNVSESGLLVHSIKNIPSAQN
jgi:hypothetical protein